MSLSKRIALVSGASGGIGAAIANVMVREGAQVAVSDLDYESCRKNVATFQHPDKHLALKLDVTKKADILLALQQIQKKMKRPPDIVINSAGIIRPKSFLNMSEQIFDEVIEVNLKGSFLLTQLTAKAMKEENLKGAIVNISSIAANWGPAGHANYAASKAGVIAMSKSAAKELGKHGIRVNCICPGFIQNTGMSNIATSEVRNDSFKSIRIYKRFFFYSKKGNGKPPKKHPAGRFRPPFGRSRTGGLSLQFEGQIHQRVGLVCPRRLYYLNASLSESCV